MTGITKGRDHEIRPYRDKSLEFLLIAFIATAAMAGSIIYIAYATDGGHVLDGAEPTGVNAAESESEDKVELLAAEKQPEEPVYDFTEYIDNLLASAENESSK